jgi:hypothetical protein
LPPDRKLLGIHATWSSRWLTLLADTFKVLQSQPTSHEQPVMASSSAIGKLFSADVTANAVE